MSSTVLLAADPLPLALVTSLEGLSYEVAMAEDGRSVLHHLKNRKPDLLILDANILEASGLGTCDRLHRALGRADLPVLMLSTFQGLREQSAARLVRAKLTLTNPSASQVTAVAEGLLGQIQVRQAQTSYDARLWRTAS